MSRSHQLQLHISQLQEIRTILNAMKNLAFMEIHKLGRFQGGQSQAVTHIEQAATDLLTFYPGLIAPPANTRQVAIILGSECGFCGDFNETLIQHTTQQAFSDVILIGSRLRARWQHQDNQVAILAELAGANVTEEVPAILNNLVNSITDLQQQYGSLGFTAVYHANTHITQKQVFPPFTDLTQQPATYKIPPLLNLPPSQLMTELISHYLLAVLHHILYLSLQAENLQRLQHLDAAVQHLDEETIVLQRKSQIYRQEEITEEIEVILLNADSVS